MPEEFKKDLMFDTTLMFEKTVLNPIYRVINAIGWDVKNPLLNEKVDLLSMLG
jgi:hypothetical protein